MAHTTIPGVEEVEARMQRGDRRRAIGLGESGEVAGDAVAAAARGRVR